MKMAETKVAQELVQFLRISAKPELKIAALENVVGLTNNATGISFILKYKDVLEALLSLLKDKVREVADNAYKAVINLSADDSALKCIIDDYDIITDLIKTICYPESFNADGACKILNNLTRTEKGALEFLKKCEKKIENDKNDNFSDSKLKELIDIFCKTKFNENGSTLDHIGTILTNVTQTEKGRKLLLDHESPLIGQLLPFLNPDSSPLLRRRGISMTIKNCCFDHEHHEWLLGEEVGILEHLLLPLAGGEEFSEDENESLPLDLQYLPEDKKREPDSSIRIILLESLLLLCADKPGRMILKNSGTYYIIRELHQWEIENGPEENGEQCEKLVQILIADEPEPGMENLWEIPNEKLKLDT
uniref:protein HGH1 homolog n=1 Tax=Styela clava TaxID=7725 RepID=UPI0019395B74|nr:protein HGH1 homolog [Styela clava]